MALCSSIKAPSLLRAVNRLGSSSASWCEIQQLRSLPAQAGQVDNVKQPLPGHADIVVIGGGVVGCSVAYHLRQRLPDKSVLLLEQGAFGCGTTWHAAGLVGQLRGSKAETLLSGVYGAKLYEELEQLTGLSAGFRRCGSLILARTPQRLDALQRQASRARSWGLEAHEVSAADAAALCKGLLDPEVFCGGISLPADGVVDASNVCALFASAARILEADLREGVKVLGIDPVPVADRGVPRGFGVRTDAGDVHANDCVVNCSGQWARQVGQLSSVQVPLHSCQHFYVYTRPGAFTVPHGFPFVRDPDCWLYSREWSGGLLVGSFEPNAKSVFPHGKVPPKFEFQLLENDWEHFLPYLEQACEAFPSLADAQVDLLNGPESFTSDGRYLMGESPEIPNYFVAAGMNSSGIASAGGVGRQIADWIGDGRLRKHLWSIDFRRVQKFQQNQRFLCERAIETLGNHYAINAPKTEPKSARGIRRSPLYTNLVAAGAKFGVEAGWEQPNFFASPEQTAAAVDGESPSLGAGLQPKTWGEPAWYPSAAKEYEACMTEAALFDLSAAGKLLVVGEGALETLSWLCTNELKPGFVTNSPMCNGDGGIEALVAVRELSPGSYLVTTGADKVLRDKAWIETAAIGNPLTVIDVSPMYSILAVVGPKADAVVGRLLGNSGDSWEATLQEWLPGEERAVDMGLARGRLTRSRPCGLACHGRRIPSWELLLEADVAQHVLEAIVALVSEDASLHLNHAGHLALDAIRVEAAFPRWGLELTSEGTPLEAGMKAAVKFGKPGPAWLGQAFLGEEALQRNKEANRALCAFEVDLPAEAALPWIWGGEPIMLNGGYSGQNLTSAARLPRLGPDCGGAARAVGLGYLSAENGHPTQDWIDSADLAIEVGADIVPVKAKRVTVDLTCL